MKITIIGGGVSGLSAGIYAQLAGFESSIYEKEPVLGGQCTGWDRMGYHIDGCIHWLTGTKDGSGINTIWKETGVLGNTEIIQLESFGTYEFDGTSITLWRDLDRLRDELIRLSPEDTGVIENMVRDIRIMQKMVIPVSMPLDMMPLREKLAMLWVLMGTGGIMTRNSKTSCAEYAKRFRHPAIRKIIEKRVPPDFSVLAFLFGMGNFTGGNGAIPRGGSRGMIERMEKRYRDLGGTVYTNMAAEEIQVEGTRARAVRFADGSAAEADYVVASCDTNITFSNLLKGRFRDKRFELRYNNPRDYPTLSTFHTAFGVSADLKEYPSSLVFEIDPLKVGHTVFTSLGVRNYAYEPDFAPPGNTVITTAYNQTGEDYHFWKKLYSSDRKAYRREKKAIAEAILDRIQRRFPELSGKIRVLDEATPVTYNRYTGAWRGSWMSFMMTPKAKIMMHSGRIRGLKNCFLTGQWLQPPGGLPTAAIYGKFTIQRICRLEGRPILFPSAQPT
ncbi:phytoene desaturase family protein [Breznakiella homolactica]|uniref:NAD(P)/FAD-dependent oxidoreductase n=1 Tax=Breznakiella homolactica TaxID=2798577 RepID=A0A7T7XLB4_9SPIR|nr:NAD(P)/FAD-dependent oxidoreductase [Breznakiella homolactica]QQO08317.1 NAD(P)/FAD-dependent oxidoreductase [Breznakiella homolactica]